MKTLKQFTQKTTIALAIIAVTSGTFANVATAKSPQQSSAEPSSHSTLVGAASGATMGAMAAGPVGAVVGGVLGIMLGNDVEQDKRLDETHTQLLASQRSLTEMNSQLIAWQQKAMLQPVTITEAAPIVLPELTTSIQFRTGDSKIEDFYTEQLGLVGDMLNSFAGLSVHVSGYADVRGDEEENKKLSFERAKVIRTALLANGVSQQQISISAMGERASNSNSSADTQTVEDYFFDRKAVITIAPREKILTASHK